MENYEKLKEEIRKKRLGINPLESTNQNINTVNDVGFDDYDIIQMWQKLKRLVDKTEPRLYKFLFKQTKRASIDARNNINEIRKLSIDLREAIIKQREDNESDYSNK
jgi:hypothetical protein